MKASKFTDAQKAFIILQGGQRRIKIKIFSHVSFLFFCLQK